MVAFNYEFVIGVVYDDGFSWIKSMNYIKPSLTVLICNNKCIFQVLLLESDEKFMELDFSFRAVYDDEFLHFKSI